MFERDPQHRTRGDEQSPASVHPRRHARVAALACAAIVLLPLAAAAEPRPGLTVTSHDYSFDGHSIMIGSDGLPVIAYAGWSGAGATRLMVAHCEDIACTTATLTEVHAEAGTWGIGGASLTIGADGFPLVSFIDADGDLRVAHCADVACSTATISPVLHANSGASALRNTSITTGIDGRGLIAFHDADRKWAFIAHCNDAACSSAQVTVISPNANLSPALTIGADGYGVMAFMDTDGALVAAHCQNVACSLSDQSLVDASPGGNGWGSSITIGTDGLPLIAYHHDNNSSPYLQLRVAHCSDGSCTSSVKTTVAPVVDGYNRSSISIGSDGLGVVAYRAGVELRLAHCGNVACTTAGRLVAVPEVPFGPTGIDASMTIGTDGLPIIASSFSGEMKVAHLSDRFGLPYHRRR